MTDSVVEKLRVYKHVCQKIRSSLIAGREEVVSPGAVSRSFLELFDKIAPAASTDSGIYPGEGGDSPTRGSECPFVEAAEGWTVEYGEGRCERCGSLCTCPRPPPCLELRPMAEAAFRQHFYQREHWNFFTEEPDIGPCLLSFKLEHDPERYRFLVRSSDHYLHGEVGLVPLGLAAGASREEAVAAVGRVMGLTSFFKPAQFSSIQEELLRIDETFVKSHYKVGLLLVKPEQRTEEEIFANDHEAGCFDDFLNLLGERVRLKGFDRFLGGLDGDKGMTGQESVFTEFRDLELMFHVAPLMPYSPYDPQQVNKKRHIGNDIVCMVFLEDSQTVFNPSWIRSHFIHCYVVVQRVVGALGQPLYRVAATSRSTVPRFQPDLWNTAVFAHGKTLQQFLLSKIINAERASYHAPKFLKLTNRSRGQLLIEFATSLTECSMAFKQGRASRRISRRSNWLPIGASRPPSPLLDSVREKYSNPDRLAEDFTVAFQGCELADVVFIVGEDRIPLYAVKALLACRSRVMCTLFKEVGPHPAPHRLGLSSPMARRRLPSSQVPFMSPQSCRKNSLVGGKARLSSIGRKKKLSGSGETSRSVSPSDSSSSSSAGGPCSFGEDPRNMQIKEQYVVEEFGEVVFSNLLSYLMTGSCSILPSTVVGLACAAERYEVAELKQACFERLPDCLSIGTVCSILSGLERYLSFGAAKTMIVRCLEFVDSNAADILSSRDFLALSENLVHLVLRRDGASEAGTALPEVLKVKAAFAWGERHAKPGTNNFKALVTPLVKNVRLHLIEPQDIMKTLAPSGIFDMDKLMTALAYQVDPQSVETDNFTMFRPRKKSSVLSSR